MPDDYSGPATIRRDDLTIPVIADLWLQRPEGFTLGDWGGTITPLDDDAMHTLSGAWLTSADFTIELEDGSTARVLIDRLMLGGASADVMGAGAPPAALLA